VTIAPDSLEVGTKHENSNFSWLMLLVMVPIALSQPGPSNQITVGKVLRPQLGSAWNVIWF